jgi:hypothetical protein
MSVSEEFLKRLDTLDDKLGTTARDMWPKLVNAEKLQVIENLLVASVCLIFSVVSAYISYSFVLHYYTTMPDGCTDFCRGDQGWAWLAVVFGFGSAIALLISMFHFFDRNITRWCEPEAEALKNLLS